MALLAAAVPAAAGAAQTVRWEPWTPLPVVDVVGPRSDGRLVAASEGGLFLVDPDGHATPFADGYSTDPAFESYIAHSPGLDVAEAGCRFEADDVYALELTAPIRLVRIDAAGRASDFVTLPGAELLSGITFDTVGRFGRRLLVTALREGRTDLLAVDCRARVATVVAGAPAVEGGMAVAPLSFGRFGGALIAPDEHSGDLIAFRPDGTSEVVLRPPLPAGADVGVESLGFVPAGFFPGGAAYVADRRSPGAPTAGTDTILRMTAEALRGVGVRAGDLLVSTESVGRTMAVRCEQICFVLPVGEATADAHIEGHITFVADPAASTPPAPVATPADGDGEGSAPWQVFGAAASIVAAVAAVALARRRGRRRPAA